MFQFLRVYCMKTDALQNLSSQEKQLVHLFKSTHVYVQETEPSNGRRIYDCCPLRAREEEVWCCHTATESTEVRGQRSGWLSAGLHWNAKHVHTLLSVLWSDFIVASKIHVTITAQFFWFYSQFFSADHHPCFLHTLRNILSSIACVICFWSSTEVQTELMFVQRAWLYSCHQTEPNEGVTQNKTKLVSLLYLAAITQNRF